MTKSELKPGYVVRYRNGELRMVMQLDNAEYVFVEMVLDKSSWWAYVKEYNEDLTCTFNRNHDIMEIYGLIRCASYTFQNQDMERHRKLLWKRKEKKKYTYAQLREILGEEFEVVNE